MRTRQSFHVWAIGVVTQVGQSSFDGDEHVRYIRNEVDALHAAMALAVPARRVFMLDLDTGRWTALSPGGASSP